MNALPARPQGLLIMGWVAMWRPINIFLYDWWPLRQRQKALVSLAVIPCRDSGRVAAA